MLKSTLTDLLFDRSLPSSLKLITVYAVLLFYCSGTAAQTGKNTPYYPTHEEILQRYIAGARMDSAVKGKVYNTRVLAHWDKDGQGFWYKRALAGGKTSYRYVRAASGKNLAAFDQAELAHLLGKKLRRAIEADSLPITDLMKVATDDNLWAFSADGQVYRYDAGKKVLTLVGKGSHARRQGARQRHFHGEVPDFRPRPSRYDSFQTDSVSPDGRQAVTVKAGNLFRIALSSGKEQQLTTDGSPENPYGSVAWSPDSKFFVAYHVFPVIDSNVYYVLSSVPGTTRGQLRSHPYKQPGDPFTAYEMHCFFPDQNKDVRVKTDTIDYFPAPLLHWNSRHPSRFIYERIDRGNQRFRIIEVNADSGDTAQIYDEKTNTFIYESRLMTYYLPGTDELIYSSEKDGWQHLYLRNIHTGKETKITKGDWIVRDVDSVDSVKREIWFSASGMQPGEDPYYVHYYRIGFDGSHLVSLTAQTGNHSVRYSPDKKYLLDTYSEVGTAPVTLLKRTADGKVVSMIEKADIQDLMATGVGLPAPFVAKGRDGLTDIYGVFCKPSHYDPNKKYPVIENIYAGPQDAFVPKSFLPYSEMQSIAELGFIVVQIDGMGTANRSKAFHDVCWKDIEDAGLPDRILWIKALAARYDFVDDSRVGIYGTSAGGQNALNALLSYPVFYKAGVAACGCHDNRIDKQWWNEQWMGYPVGPQYAAASNVDNAYKLKSSLLLIVGEADTNVPPESTYRVADALIKAGKAFDFLPVPGSDHTDGGPYGRARKKDFFVRHLLKVEPPDHNRDNQFILPKTGVR